MAAGAVRRRHRQLHPAHGLALFVEQRTLLDPADEDTGAEQTDRGEPGKPAWTAVSLDGGAQAYLVAVEVGAVVVGQVVVDDRKGVPGDLLPGPAPAGTHRRAADLAPQP